MFGWNNKKKDKKKDKKEKKGKKGKQKNEEPRYDPVISEEELEAFESKVSNPIKEVKKQVSTWNKSPRPSRVDQREALKLMHYLSTQHRLKKKTEKEEDPEVLFDPREQIREQIEKGNKDVRQDEFEDYDVSIKDENHRLRIKIERGLEDIKRELENGRLLVNRQKPEESEALAFKEWIGIDLRIEETTISFLHEDKAILKELATSFKDVTIENKHLQKLVYKFDQLALKTMKELEGALQGFGISSKEEESGIGLPYKAKLTKELRTVRLEEVKVLGGGSFGTVQKIRVGGEKGTDYAFKTFGDQEQLASKEVSREYVEEQEKELKREIEIYEKVGDHPNIAKCYGEYTVGGKKGMVMEITACGSAENVLNRAEELLAQGEITFGDKVAILQHILEGTMKGLLQFERSGFVHLDIKAGNIGVDEHLEPKIIDLGAGEQVETPITAKAKGLDNPFTVDPLIYTEEKATFQNDMFSSGQMLYKTIEGKDFLFHSEPLNRLFLYEKPAMQFVEEANRLAVEKMSKEDKGDLDYELKDISYGFAKELGEVKEKLNIDLKKVKDKDIDGEQRKGLIEKSNLIAKEIINRFETAIRETRLKYAGKYSSKYESQYMQFINLMLHPDPERRLTPSQALEHPFMKDSLMNSRERKDELLGKLFPDVLEKRQEKEKQLEEEMEKSSVPVSGISSKTIAWFYDMAGLKGAAEEITDKTAKARLLKNGIKYRDFLPEEFEEGLDNKTFVKVILEGDKLSAEKWIKGKLNGTDILGFIKIKEPKWSVGTTVKESSSKLKIGRGKRGVKEYISIKGSDPTRWFAKQKDYEDIRERLSKYGLEISETSAKGNCLFDAIVDQLKQNGETKPTITDIREALSALMLEKKNLAALKKYILQTSDLSSFKKGLKKEKSEGSSEDIEVEKEEEVFESPKLSDSTGNEKEEIPEPKKKIRSSSKDESFEESEEEEIVLPEIVERLAYNIVQNIADDNSWNNTGGDLAPDLLPLILGRDLIIFSPNGGHRVIRPGAGTFRAVPGNRIGNGTTPLVIVYNGINHYLSTKPK